MKKENKIKFKDKKTKSSSHLKISFKEYIITFGYDLALYVITFLSLLGWSKAIQVYSSKLASLNLSALDAVNQELAQESLAIVRSFITKTILTTLLFIVILFLVYTLFKSLIWFRVNKKKFSFKYSWKLMLLNLIHLGFAFILFVMPIRILFIRYQAGIETFGVVHVFLILVVIIFIYFRAISYILFTKTKKIKVFKEIFDKGFDLKGKIKPLLIIIGIFIGVNILSIVLNIMPSTINIFLVPILYLAYNSWVRFYFTKKVVVNGEKTR
ncbi:MAG: hypothetical protein KAQ83_03965 [Nanoarchaeota archaeon]|nr:hypothetical protein [Nanoarchaeota archaeon]